MPEEKQIEEYLEEAIKLAAENVATGEGGPFGALVTKNGEIIARGKNQVTGSNDPSAHAEIVAIREACGRLQTFDLSGCEIYASCEPCPMCFGAIYWARIDALYYAASKHDAAEAGFDDSFIYEELAKSEQQRRVVTTHRLHELGRQPFQQWIEAEKKRPY